MAVISCYNVISLKTTFVKITQNIFFKDVLSAWCKCTANAVILSYRHNILWNNSHIKAGANTIMFANWYHNGIKFFKDIYDHVTKRYIYTIDYRK